jgi:hypothetical protein
MFEPTLRILSVKNHLSGTNCQVVCTKAPSFISRYYSADEVALGFLPKSLVGPGDCKKVFGCVFLLNLARTYADKIPIDLFVF